MAVNEDGVEPYGFDGRFEAALVVLACTRPRFYGRLATDLDPACLHAPAARLALQAAHAISTSTGQGPDGSMVLFQRLSSWRHEGKVTEEQILEVVDLFDDAEDAGLPSEEAVLGEAVPVLRSRIRRKAVEFALDAHKSQRDLSRVVEMEKRASRLGQVDTSIGKIVGEASFGEIEYLRTLERLPTHIMELDIALNGGLQRAGIGIMMANSGGGKSMFLSHVAGVSACDGHIVACVSLELPQAIWHARVIANMTGIPIDALLADETIKDRALAELSARQGTGLVVVQQMPAMGTTVDDIIGWVGNVEEHIGRDVTVLIVDFVDKLAAPKVKNKEVGTYEAGKQIMEALRGYAEDNNKWCWSASHSTGRTKKNKKLDMGDAAESMHKPRISDLWITAEASDDQEEISFFIAKHRTAKSRMTIGPLPTEFECGRMAPIS